MSCYSKSLILKRSAWLALLASSMVPLSHAQGFQVASLGDNTLSIRLIDKQGDTIKQYLGKLKGSMTVNLKGGVTALDGTIQSLETEDKKSISITKTELKNGTVVVTTKDGAVYTISDLNSQMVGRIRLTKPANSATTQRPAAK